MTVTVSEYREVSDDRDMKRDELVKDYGKVQLSVFEGRAIISDNKTGSVIAMIHSATLVWMNKTGCALKGYAPITGGASEFRKWYVS